MFREYFWDILNFPNKKIYSYQNYHENQAHLKMALNRLNRKKYKNFLAKCDTTAIVHIEPCNLFLY